MSMQAEKMIFLEANVAFQVLAKEGSLVRPQVRVLFRESSTHEHVVSSSFCGSMFCIGRHHTLHPENESL